MQENGTDSAAVSSDRETLGARGTLRWYGVALGLLGGAADTTALRLFGTTFFINGHDATVLMAAWFGISFAILGFLLGDSIDRRRRERSAAQLIRTQMETIAIAHNKIIQNEKLAALGQLAAAIAHEVRNPLAVIRSAAQNLRDTMPTENPDARRACTFITEEADRLGILINSLLAFARPVQISAHHVPVTELFERALSATGDEISARRLRVHRPAAAELGMVNVDPDLMSQVFVGLVENAIAAVPSGGELTLDARRSNGSVELTVADSGPGVPPELRSRVFEPFFTTRAEGIGLGLAIARQIVEAHGGRIEVGPSTLGGARFAVTLPAATQASVTTQ